MFRKLGLIIISASMLMTACGEATVQPASRQYTSSDLDPRVVEGSNSFGLQLFREMTLAHPSENIFLSPISISAALTMAYHGASGQTASEMAKTLGVEPIAMEELGRGYRVALDLLTHPADEEITLEIANSLWMRRGYSFHDSYIQRSQNDYSSEIGELIFSSPNAARTINRWVKKKTNGKIPSIVDNIQPQSVLYLLNAVYFEGKWTEPFASSATKNGDFKLNASESIEVKMMAKSGLFEYGHSEGYQVIKLPFGKMASMSMVLLLPDEGEDSGELLNKLAAEPARLTDTFEKHAVTVELPRVHLEYEASLNDYLKAMGMREAFDSNLGDFSNMAPSPPNLFINNVKHKTFLEITEQGTVAAATTKVDMQPVSSPLEDRFHLVINRPFLLAIVDHETDHILFAGSILNPKG